MEILHVKSITVGDSTDTNSARPIDWNSRHRLSFALGGNTTIGSSTTGTAVPIAATGGMSVGISNGSLLFSAPALGSYYRPYELGNNTSFSAHGQNSISMAHFVPPNRVHMSNIEIWGRGTFASSTNSQSFAMTIDYGLYSRGTGANSTQMSLCGSSRMLFSSSYNSNTANGHTMSQGAGSFTTSSGATAGLAGNLSGPNMLYLPYSTTMSGGVRYAFAMRIQTTGASQAGGYFPLQLSMMNSRSLGRMSIGGFQAANVSVIGEFEMGTYSATSSSLPNSYATSQLGVAVSRMVPYIQFED